MWRDWLTSGLLVVVLVASACGGDGGDGGGGNGEGGAQQVQEYTFILPYDEGFPNAFGITLAKELGYFEEEGVDLTIEVVDGGEVVNQQIAAGRGFAGLTGSSSVPLAVAQGQDLVSFFEYAYGSIYRFGVPVDSDIQEISDLAGKTIGITEPGGGEVVIMRAALAERGIDPDADVDTVPIGEGGPQALQALESGQVDAYMAATNDLAALGLAGLELRQLALPEIETFPATSIIANSADYEQSRDAIIALGRGMAKAMVFASENRDAAEAILTAAYPDAWAEPEIPSTLLDFWIEVTRPPPEANGQYGWTEISEWEALEAYVAQGAEAGPGEAPEAADLAEVVDTSFLAEFNDFDAEAVRSAARDYEA
jgi:NitT/TauT family transport system substrate-binding protein